jgi:hypothetical protein
MSLFSHLFTSKDVASPGDGVFSSGNPFAMPAQPGQQAEAAPGVRSNERCRIFANFQRIPNPVAPPQLLFACDRSAKRRHPEGVTAVRSDRSTPNDDLSVAVYTRCSAHAYHLGRLIRPLATHRARLQRISSLRSVCPPQRRYMQTMPALLQTLSLCEGRLSRPPH